MGRQVVTMLGETSNRVGCLAVTLLGESSNRVGCLAVTLLGKTLYTNLKTSCSVPCHQALCLEEFAMMESTFRKVWWSSNVTGTGRRATPLGTEVVPTDVVVVNELPETIFCEDVATLSMILLSPKMAQLPESSHMLSVSTSDAAVMCLILACLSCSLSKNSVSDTLT